MSKDFETSQDAFREANTQILNSLKAIKAFEQSESVQQGKNLKYRADLGDGILKLEETSELLNKLNTEEFTRDDLEKLTELADGIQYGLREITLRSDLANEYIKNEKESYRGAESSLEQVRDKSLMEAISAITQGIDLGKEEVARRGTFERSDDDIKTKVESQLREVLESKEVGIDPKSIGFER